MLELDSSTPTKFSRHIIVTIPGAAFQSNAHVGAFVKDMVCPGHAAANTGSQQANEHPCPQLLVNKVCCSNLGLFPAQPCVACVWLDAACAGVMQ